MSIPIFSSVRKKIEKYFWDMEIIEIDGKKCFYEVNLTSQFPLMQILNLLEMSFDTIGKYSILKEYVLRMDLMHSENLVILYTMSGCIPSYGVHCPSRNTPQRNLRKRGDLIWGDLVAHSSLVRNIAINSVSSTWWASYFL